MSAAGGAVDALVVGGGPAGLAAATCAEDGRGRGVLVVEREDEAGGVPRHCHHSGFGVRDLHRVLQGPVYARRWVDRASDAGAAIWTRTMVTGWSADGHAEVTGPEGRRRIRARAVVLATGARERARAALLVPGSRPTGVFTTGQLQQWVYRERLPVGRRALVVGAEHVSYSAVLTLREAGVRTVALATGLPAPPDARSLRPGDPSSDSGSRSGPRPRWPVSYGKDHVEMVRLCGPAGQVRRGGRRRRRLHRTVDPRPRVGQNGRSVHGSGGPAVPRAMPGDGPPSTESSPPGTWSIRSRRPTWRHGGRRRWERRPRPGSGRGAPARGSVPA